MPTIHLPTLHSGQVAAYNTPGRFRALRAGRRWGKTKLSAAIVCDGAARGEYWGIFTPQYKYLSETYREIDETLLPIKKSGNKMEGVIYAISGGRVDFWTLENPNAGRGRKYHGVVLDEVAFAGPDMKDIWEKSIKPALLDYRGGAWALSTPAGKDEDNWFYSICTDPEQGWVEFHAPTSSNPHLPADEIALLQATNSPEVYRQEYLAEFVDWSGVAFFPLESFLVNGKPVPMPPNCDVVGAIIDTAIKSGQEHNSTAVLYFSFNHLLDQCTTWLDWDLLQIEGADQAEWLPSVYAHCEALARECGARQGSIGALIEDKATGTVLLQQARNLGQPAHALNSKYTAMGKDERAIAASQPIYNGKVKIAERAFNKTKVHKGVSANHLLRQVTNFRVGSKLTDGLDLLDCATYSVIGTCLPNLGDLRNKVA